VLSIKLTTSASFRAISKIMVLVNLYLDLNIKTPSHVSILLWVKKMGIYQLNKVHEKSDDWILMIDESIEFGHEKLLVILGIREANIDFSRALNYNDMNCLKVMVSCSWKGEDIKKVLDELSLKIGTIKYVVADMGNSIKRALKLSSITHIQDINHKISWFIKELYKDYEIFTSYTQRLAFLRGALCLSSMSHILPPQQRAHSRYMNLKPLFDWGMAILQMLDSETSDPLEKEKMLHLRVYETLIRQTHQLIGIANRIQEILKNNGLSEQTKGNCLNLFDCVTDIRVLKFKDMIEGFLTNMINSVKGDNKILCSSDILESSFGKYKNYISANNSIGITDLALSIPAFTNKSEPENVKKAMEGVKVEQIKQWKTDYIGDTQLTKRRESLKTGGRKKSLTTKI